MTITTLRPMVLNSVPAGWRDQGGATSLDADLADNSDSTWVRGTIFYPSAGYQASLGMSNLGTVSSSQRILRTRLRVRVGKTGGGGTADERASFALYYTGSGKRTDNKGVTIKTTTPAEHVFAWWPKAPHGAEWTKGIVDNQIFALLVAYKNAAGVANGLKVFELYWDVDVRTVASVTAVAADGVTTTAQPTITWDFVTNADSDPQRSYDVKVFTQAQTTAAGFNPATTAPIWGSGVVRSTAEQALVAKSLINGVAYVAYVRSSIDFNNSDWWSAWTASSAFTMAYVAPPTPVLTVAPETVLPSLRCLLTVDTKLNLLTADESHFEESLGTWASLANATLAYLLGGTGTETTLNTNPTFEVNANGWLLFEAASFVRSTAQFQTGAASGLLTPTGSDWYPGVSTTNGDITGLTPGQTYLWRVWVRSPNAIQVRQTIHWKKTDNSSISVYNPGPTVTLVANTWTFMEMSGVAPALGTRATPAVYIEGAAAPGVGDVFYIDEARFTNFAAAPVGGAAIMRLTAASAATMSAATTGTVDAYPVTPGQQYTASAYFRTAVTARSCNVKLRWLDAAANTISTSSGSNVTDSTGAWTQATVTATAPESASMVRVIVEVVSPANAEIHYVSAVALNAGASGTWTYGGLQKGQTDGDVRHDSTRIEFLDWNQTAVDTPNIINANLATGGEAYGDASGFAPRSTKDAVAVDRTGKQHQGEACLRWTVGETTGSILDLGTAQGSFSSFADVPTHTLPCVPGRVYSFSVYVRTITGSTNMQAGLAAIDGTGAFISSNGGTVISVGTTWTRISVSHTAPAGSAGFRGEVRNSSGTLTTFFIDSAQLEEGASVSPWQPSSIQVTAWQPVRGALDDLESAVGNGISQIFDREIPPGVIRLYRARVEIDLDVGDIVRSPYSTYIPAEITAPGVFLIKDPQEPRWDLQPTAVGLIGSRIDEDLTELHPARPLAAQPYGQRAAIASDWISGRNGQMTISVRGAPAWFTLRSLLWAQRALLVQLPQGGQRYVRLTSRNWPENRTGFDVWKVVVDFAEVDRPPVVG